VKGYIHVQTKNTGAVSKALKSLSQVSSVALTTGIFDVLAHAEFENLDEANEVILKLRELEEVEHASVLLIDKIIE